jgi:hypothetical protein
LTPGTGDVALFDGGDVDVEIDPVEDGPEMRW